jgi:hypothetical protein
LVEFVVLDKVRQLLVEKLELAEPRPDHHPWLKETAVIRDA